MRASIIAVALLVHTVSLCGQTSSDDTPWRSPFHFSAQPAQRTIEQIGLFSDSRARLGERWTLAVHPLAFLASPTAEVQYLWTSLRDPDPGFSGITDPPPYMECLSTWHRISYPSPLLRLLQGHGAGGVITPEVPIGPVVSIANGVRASWYEQHSTFTIEAGVAFALGRLDERVMIDVPIVYPRMVIYQDGWQISARGTYEVMLSEHIQVTGSAAAFASIDHQFIELTPRVSWVFNEHWAVHLDPVVTWGMYPFGNEWQMVILPDLTYRF